MNQSSDNALGQNVNANERDKNARDSTNRIYDHISPSAFKYAVNDDAREPDKKLNSLEIDAGDISKEASEMV